MKIWVTSEAFVSDTHSRWCHVHIAVVICHSHWVHCRLFCCTKHVNKQKMTADAMASRLRIMMSCSIRRHSCQMHMWVISCTSMTWYMNTHCVPTYCLISRCPCDNVCVCPSHPYVDNIFSCCTVMRTRTVVFWYILSIKCQISRLRTSVSDNLFQCPKWQNYVPKV
jgi:hypothetical protein